MEELILQDRVIEILVKVGDKKMRLREADGEVVTKWKNAQFKATKFKGDGRPSHMENMADTEPYLVSLCLYYTDEGGNIRVDKEGDPDKKFLVAERTIRRWPADTQTKLFETLKRISKLDEKDTVESLQKKITDLTDKLDKLKEEEDEKAALNGHTGGQEKNDV